MGEPVLIQAPIRGEWAIFNPPGHPTLAFDLLAVDERKNPYKNTSLARHVFSQITVENTLASVRGTSRNCCSRCRRHDRSP